MKQYLIVTKDIKGNEKKCQFSSVNEMMAYIEKNKLYEYYAFRRIFIGGIKYGNKERS